jgi:hypothetical protein
MISVVIQKQLYDDVKKYDKIRYNTNNIWTQSMTPSMTPSKPSDYDEKIKLTFTSQWIDSFFSHYIILNIPLVDWMYDVSNISQMTHKFSKLYSEELDQYILHNESEFIKDYLDKNDIFIRGETVSLKEGIYGIRPYKSLKQIIESICTSSRGHSILDNRDNKQNTNKIIKLYLLKWIDIIEFQEFRVFVKNKKITAISQQNLYKINTILEKLSEKEINIVVNKWIQIIIKYFESNIVNKIVHISDYCIDMAILKDDKPYFIEINCFGAEYPSGSALFEWISDFDILNGKKSEIYFRYTG